MWIDDGRCVNMKASWNIQPLSFHAIDCYFCWISKLRVTTLSLSCVFFSLRKLLLIIVPDSVPGLTPWFKWNVYARRIRGSGTTIANQWHRSIPPAVARNCHFYEGYSRYSSYKLVHNPHLPSSIGELSVFRWAVCLQGYCHTRNTPWPSHGRWIDFSTWNHVFSLSMIGLSCRILQVWRGTHRLFLFGVNALLTY